MPLWLQAAGLALCFGLLVLFGVVMPAGFFLEELRRERRHQRSLRSQMLPLEAWLEPLRRRYLRRE